MSKISVKRRQFTIKQKRKRKAKIKGLKERYLKAKTEKEKKKISDKIQKIAPHYALDSVRKEEK